MHASAVNLVSPMKTLGGWIDTHLEHLAVVGRSPRTVLTARAHLRWFFQWCEARGIVRAEEVTRPILERYQRHLFYYRQAANGRPLSSVSQALRLTMVRGLFRYLVRQGVLLANPASELELPKQRVRLPRDVLSKEEAEAVLLQPDIAQPLGLRDRAMLEVLYGAGLRRLELVGLDVFDIDRSRGIVHVRHGKGDKERLVPMGERALFWVEKYMEGARALLLTAASGEALFLSRLGERLGGDRVTACVKGYVAASGIAKRSSCHGFRHTMATLMLEGGADIRFVQAMLGHESLDATQIYTRVAVGMLSEVHARTHPGARLVAPAKE
jgi:integrase/recombinase XerD